MLLTLPCDACGVLATLTFLSLSRDLVIGRKFLSVTRHLPTGRCQNFVHLVTGHTPGRIDRNGTVLVAVLAVAVAVRRCGFIFTYIISTDKSQKLLLIILINIIPLL